MHIEILLNNSGLYNAPPIRNYGYDEGIRFRDIFTNTRNIGSLRDYDDLSSKTIEMLHISGINIIFDSNTSPGTSQYTEKIIKTPYGALEILNLHNARH